MAELQTNYLVQPVDPASAMLKAGQATNYLAAAREAPLRQNILRAQYQNVLAERPIAQARLEQQVQVQQAQLTETQLDSASKRATQYEKVISAPSWDVAQKIAGIYGIDVSQSDWTGDKITLLDNHNNFKISGPRTKIAEAMQTVATDPSWLTSSPMGTDPTTGQPIPGTKIQHFMAWSASNGLSFERSQAPQEATPIAAGTIQSYQKGRDKIFREKQADGTWKEISKGQMDVPENGMEVPTPQQAIDKVSDITTKIANFDKDSTMTDVLAAIMATSDPKIAAKFAAKKGQELNPTEKTEAKQALNAALNWYKQYLPKNYGTQQNVMNEMPDPVANSGRIIKDTQTGKRYKSNGTTWVEIQ